MKNPELVILRGLPASGKTTFAREWVAEDSVNRARVNRDDLRQMFHEGQYSRDMEYIIRKARDAIIVGLLGRGTSVVVDDTNLRQKDEFHLKWLADMCSSTSRVVDFTEVGLETCIERDAARQNPIGEPEIRRLYYEVLLKEREILGTQC